MPGDRLLEHALLHAGAEVAEDDLGEVSRLAAGAASTIEVEQRPALRGLVAGRGDVVEPRERSARVSGAGAAWPSPFDRGRSADHRRVFLGLGRTIATMPLPGRGSASPISPLRTQRS